MDQIYVEDPGSASTLLTARARGAYLGLAVGDALGATLEFMTAREIAQQYGVHDRIIGGGWLHLKAGQVTDDTTMSLALGRAILDKNSVDPLAIASAFDKWMQAKPVDIGNTIRRGIVHFRYSGTAEAPASEYAAGNGACMRCLPVALFTYLQAEEMVRHASRVQAHVTHHNNISDAGTECVIAMIHAALSGKSKTQIWRGPVTQLVLEQPLFSYRPLRRENPGGYIVETLQAVLQAFFDTGDFRSCLVDVVNRGGDSDTTGAIAGMIAGGFYGEKAIPSEWLGALEPSVRAECISQAESLLKLALQQARQVETGD